MRDQMRKKTKKVHRQRTQCSGKGRPRGDARLKGTFWLGVGGNSPKFDKRTLVRKTEDVGVRVVKVGS